MANTPSNKSARKPVAKKKYSLAQYKKKTNLVDIPDKPVEWITTSKAMQDVTGLLGFPRGYTSLSRGYSNTGKSTSLLEGMVGSQRKKSVPIIIDLENNIGRYRLEQMGFDWGGDYIKIENDYLLKTFGRKRNPKIGEASIEDLAACINDFIDQQEAGHLPYNLDFYIDSIGVLNCVNTIKALEKDSSTNNMWNAFAYEQSFKGLLNARIPASRKETSEYTNTLIAVQKIWLDSMQGKGAVKHKGGEAFYFGSRLIYHYGGIVSHGANHIDGPLGGISMEGDIISTPHGFIRGDADGIAEYKKDKLLYFRKILGEEINEDDIMLSYHDINTVGEEKEIGVDNFNKSMAINFGGDVIDVDTNTGEVKE
jgi:hypothetical protein